MEDIAILEKSKKEQDERMQKILSGEVEMTDAEQTINSIFDEPTDDKR